MILMLMNNIPQHFILGDQAQYFKLEINTFNMPLSKMNL